MSQVQRLQSRDFCSGPGGPGPLPDPLKLGVVPSGWGTESQRWYLEQMFPLGHMVTVVKRRFVCQLPSPLGAQP